MKQQKQQQEQIRIGNDHQQFTRPAAKNLTILEKAPTKEYKYKWNT